MCFQSFFIKESIISRVLYGAKNEKSDNNNNYTQIESIDLIKKCEKIIKNKFIELRIK